MTITTTIEGAAAVIEQVLRNLSSEINAEVKNRTYRAGQALRTELLDNVLTGSRSGRTYRLPNTRARYTASAPGEPPAIRTGAYRGSFTVKSEGGGSETGGTYHAIVGSELRVKNGHLLSDYLENGNSRIAPRPHLSKALEAARPEIIRIFNERY
ncbi:MAG: hypothetical protein VB031_02175 [Eubacteriaceae bacterium]|nr:hypothetical protein [Eubacteriaceae bacterium]